MKDKQNYWMMDTNHHDSENKSLDLEFKGVKSEGVSRRNFLKMAGFSAAALMTACTKKPVEKAIPFLIQPEEVIPGKAYWYATTSHACGFGCAVLAKNRDGRTIKLEGNPDHPLSQGGLCPVCQASILELYDSKRIFQPRRDGREISWDQTDSAIIEALRNANDAEQDIILLTGTVNSPSSNSYIEKFKNLYRSCVHLSYDPLSYSAVLDAQAENFGIRVLPQYHFDRAELILSLDADFLGSWLSPIQFTKDYRKNRDLLGDKPISRHIQIEARMSITGAKADQRFVMDNDEIKLLIKDLAKALKDGEGIGLAADLAAELKMNQGKSLVVSGSNDLDVQILVNRINQVLNNIGNTIDLENTSFQSLGSDNDRDQLINRLESGNVGVLLIWGVNPVYDLPEGKNIAKLMKSVPMTVSISSLPDETNSSATINCPEGHFLEEWSDNEFTAGILSMTQPTIQPLGNNRSFRKSIATWAGVIEDERNLIRNYWKAKYSTRKVGKYSFNRWWDQLVHDGFSRIEPEVLKIKRFKSGKLTKVSNESGTGLTLQTFAAIQILAGNHAHNPWLQELPDPITKVTWDNVAMLSPTTAKDYNVNQGNVIRLTTNSQSIELPVYIQPGQHKNVIVVALGYGSLKTARFRDIGPKWFQGKPTLAEGELIGQNITPFLKNAGTSKEYSGIPITISNTSRSVDLALSQTYNTLSHPEKTTPPAMKTRPIIQTATFEEYEKDPRSGQHKSHALVSLWKEDHLFKGHHWGMAIDLSACTGCSACVVSCQVENNIPVVGRDEVLRRREMHWLRIDRYYSGENENIDVAFQPMLCQHCDNAPCEPVCPVLATVHSSEGLNQQIYNRCIGTRFCANNCPYKVRRFNWFNYTHDDLLENMVLNPDVTIRSRGVMEKCSLCVQRIQEAKIEAKRKGIKVKDGDIQLACQQSCPADAITFGDLSDPKSKIAKQVQDPRHYHVLEEINVRPTTGYLTLIRNRKEEMDSEHNG